VVAENKDGNNVNMAHHRNVCFDVLNNFGCARAGQAAAAMTTRHI
jgi:hypothetical protein